MVACEKPSELVKGRQDRYNGERGEGCPHPGNCGRGDLRGGVKSRLPEESSG
jgi:hypothetical protein